MSNRIGHYQTVIIGGGASGIAAAITLARSGKSCIILERADRIGKKIALSGAGRCNLTNKNISADKYNAPAFLANRLPDNAEIERFFDELGLKTRNVGDLVYPYSMSSSAVLDVLRYAIERYRIPLLTECEATGVYQDGDGYRVVTTKGEMKCENVVFACGTSVRPGVDSLALADMLSIKTHAFYPALTSFLSSSNMLKGLSGVRVNAVATLNVGGKKTAVTEGEILFKENEVSGIAAFDLSRFYNGERQSCVSLDLFPDMSIDKLQQKLSDRVALGFNTRENAYVGLLHKELFANVFKYLSATELNAENAAKFAKVLKNYNIDVDGLNREKAQIMRGGVDLTEITDGFQTKLNGIYVVGEFLDIDGACGGYNLSHAWYSGIIAAKQIGGKL